MKIALITTLIPHYREEFYRDLSDIYDIDIYTTVHESHYKKKSFRKSNISTKHLWNIKLGPISLFSVRPLLKGDYDILILRGSIREISNWFLIYFKKLVNVKIILWGHGISIPNYLKHQTKMPVIHKLLYNKCDLAWFYTNDEVNLWKAIYPEMPSIALMNTISGVHNILLKSNQIDKEQLKIKYGIRTQINLIFCARFENVHRRAEFLVDLVKKLDKKKFGLIIIGDGELKPDFTAFDNCYDFGSVYDESVKSDLFEIADIYFQPAWLGLSIVEAMAYGKPIFSMERSEKLYQCVEYSYVKSGYNGCLFSDIKSLIYYLEKMDDSEIRNLGRNAKTFVKENLLMENMINNAVNSIKSIQ